MMKNYRDYQITIKDKIFNAFAGNLILFFMNVILYIQVLKYPGIINFYFITSILILVLALYNLHTLKIIKKLQT
jgi:hypothetical protein